MSTAAQSQPQHRVVSEEQWIAARKELLTAEKEFTRQRDALSAKRRELPWVKVEKNYAFDGPNGMQSLSELFRGKSQLVIYHFMFGPGSEQGRPTGSYLANHSEGSRLHPDPRDAPCSSISPPPFR